MCLGLCGILLIPVVLQDCDEWHQSPNMRALCHGTETQTSAELWHASACACISFFMLKPPQRSPADIYDEPHVTILHHYIPFVLVRLQDPAHVLQKLQAVDLYCGCGGMSFIDQKTDKVHVQTQWAVDSVEAMCQSFQVNYPDATVSHGHALNCTLHAATGELFVSFKKN